MIGPTPLSIYLCRLPDSHSVQPGKHSLLLPSLVVQNEVQCCVVICIERLLLKHLSSEFSCILLVVRTGLVMKEARRPTKAVRMKVGE